MATTLDIQRRLVALGYQPGAIDGIFGDQTADAVKQFQRARNLAADGIVGPKTSAALFGDAVVAPGQTGAIVPADWMPVAKMQRIIVHWTAGAYKASGLDRSHYHILIEDDGRLVRGTPSIALNQAPVRKGYAAHTLGCNSGSIGVSLCCMAGASESPFVPGIAPMKRAQWETLPRVLAELCRRYVIAVTPKTVLSHAEVQGTLGIKQRGKWDITRLAFDPAVRGATACGDLFRAATKEQLA
ncbi:hypothetical protein MAUB1S_09722 [Mycolicibacterium aubagnense]